MNEEIIETANDVEEEREITNGSPHFFHGFKAMIVVFDGQVDISECVELGTKEECTGLLVPDELLLFPSSDDASCGRSILSVHHHLEELGVMVP